MRVNFTKKDVYSVLERKNSKMSQIVQKYFEIFFCKWEFFFNLKILSQKTGN